MDASARRPLRPSELRELGVMWLDDAAGNLELRSIAPAPVDIFVTQLHLCHDAKTFPEGLTFEITGDRENNQGPYDLAISGVVTTHRAALPVNTPVHW